MPIRQASVAFAVSVYERDNRREFAITINELVDMPAAASQGGTKPATAAGIAMRL